MGEDLEKLRTRPFLATFPQETPVSFSPHVLYLLTNLLDVCEDLQPAPIPAIQQRTNKPDALAMSIFSYIRSIYALDTIDTRFTNPSSNPYKTVVDTRAESALIYAKRDDSIPGVGVKTDRRGLPIAQPSRWRTAEFIFYYFVFLTIVPYMFWIAYDVSRRKSTVPSAWEKVANPSQLLTQTTINMNGASHQDGFLAARL